MDGFVLGVDIGSGSVKLTLLSPSGEIAGTSGCEYPTLHPQAGWCEQDPEDWCRAFGTALQDLLRRTGIPADRIRALAPDAATHTAVLLDRELRPVRRAILWTDQRSKQQVNRLKQQHLRPINQQCLNTPTTVWTLPQLMWIRENEPDRWGKIRHLLFAKDYLRFRLTGTMETDTIDAAGSMFYDVGRECWSGELCRIGGIPMEWLPALRAPTDRAGVVTQKAAEEFGLAPGTQVLVGTTDTAMEVLAAGSVEAGQTTMKLATAGRICVITREKLESEFLFNYRHVVPGLWYPGTGTACCAGSYRWYRDVLGRDSFEQLSRSAEHIPAGSDGLMFHPYLNGELTPYNDPDLRGSYTGVSSAHTAAHFTRATLEGIAMSLRDCMGALRALDVPMTRMRIIGGGAGSALWRQITADVLGTELEKTETDDSSFGSALLAAVSIGWFDDFTQAVRRCVRVSSVTRPDQARRAVYDRCFTRYRAIHDALAPIYRED